MLTPGQIANRLDHRLSLLTRGSRTAAPRQQTLRAAIDWSYELLDPEEQRLLRMLSVFRGGFTLEAVEALWAATSPDESFSADALELLGQLVDKSLVTTSDTTTGRRFGMLETIREYAFDGLEQAGETDAAVAAHRTWFGDLAATYGRQVVTADQLEALEALEADHENLRALLERTLAAGDIETVVGVAADLAHFWWLHYHFGESDRWFDRLLDLADDAPPRVRAKLLMGAGEFSMSLSNHVEADRRLTAAREIARDLGSPRHEAWAEAYMTTNELWRVDFEAAGTHAMAALQLFQDVGDLAGFAYVMFLQIATDYGKLLEAGEVSPQAAEELMKRLEPIHAGVTQLGDRNPDRSRAGSAGPAGAGCGAGAGGRGAHGGRRGGARHPRQPDLPRSCARSCRARGGSHRQPGGRGHVARSLRKPAPSPRRDRPSGRAIRLRRCSRANPPAPVTPPTSKPPGSRGSSMDREAAVRQAHSITAAARS